MCASECSPHFIFRVERRSPSIKHQKEIDLQSFFSGKTLLEVCFTNWHITASRETCDGKLTILATGTRPAAGHRGNKGNLSRLRRGHRDLRNYFVRFGRFRSHRVSMIFLGGNPSTCFLEKLENAYIEMKTTPPNTPQRVLEGMRYFISNISTYSSVTSRLRRARAVDHSEPKRFRSGCRDSGATAGKNGYQSIFAGWSTPDTT